MMYTMIVLLFVPLCGLGRSISILCIAVLNILLAVVFAIFLRRSGQKKGYVSIAFVLLILLASYAMVFFGKMSLIYTPHGALSIAEFVSMICSGIIWMVLLFLKVTTTKSGLSGKNMGKMPAWVICLSALSMLAIIILTWTVYGGNGRNLSRLLVAEPNIVLATALIVALHNRGQKKYYIPKIMALYILLASVAIIVFAIMELAGDYSFTTYYYNYGMNNDSVLSNYRDARTHFNYIQTFISMIVFGIFWIALLLFKGTTKKTAIQAQEKED